jgi:hypothetical protein|tara:strand:+ start:101 stop:472 length:372 start_codon:yes stop_codon:yes gene_type:complete
MRNNFDETIEYDKLKKNKKAEEFALTLEAIFSDVVSVPMFNDEEILIDKWGITFFHKESQSEISWSFILSLMNYINITGYKVSHVLTVPDFKFYAEIQERLCLGIPSTLSKNELNVLTIHNTK